MDRLLVLVPHCTAPSHSSVKDREVTIAVLSIISPSPTGNLSPTSLALDVKKEAICGRISVVCCLAVWHANVSFAEKIERVCWLASLAIHGQAEEAAGWETRAGTASKPCRSNHKSPADVQVKLSRKFSNAAYKPRWKKTEDKQCHPVELQQRGREPSVMGGVWWRAPKDLSTSPRELLNRGLYQQGPLPNLC